MSARAAVAAAERGTRAWRSVVAMQGATAPEQSGLQTVAGELAGTVRALELVAGMLLRRVHGHGHELVLVDDEGMDPSERLIAVAACLADLHCALGRADRAASAVWSQVEHIAAAEAS